MAAKMQCPKCCHILKEEGDGGKVAQGEYRVMDAAGYKKRGCVERALWCSVCKSITDIREFEI